jgi:hypothetical protein
MMTQRTVLVLSDWRPVCDITAVRQNHTAASPARASRGLAFSGERGFPTNPRPEIRNPTGKATGMADCLPTLQCLLPGTFVRPGFRDSNFELLSAFDFRPSVLNILPNFLAGRLGGFEAEIQKLINGYFACASRTM